jgi:cell division protein FtsN
MRNKDYRELQISSSLLVFIFLAIIVLGIIIFLLGVSVGKKQTFIAESTSFGSANQIERVIKDKPVQLEEPKDVISEEIASHEKIKEEKEKPSPPPSSRVVEKNLFYIQIGAYKNKQGADTHSEKLKNQGFACRVYNPSPTDSRQLYKIKVGGFKTRELAEKALERIASTEKKSVTDYFIIKQ